MLTRISVIAFLFFSLLTPSAYSSGDNNYIKNIEKRISELDREIENVVKEHNNKVQEHQRLVNEFNKVYREYQQVAKKHSSKTQENQRNIAEYNIKCDEHGNCIKQIQDLQYENPKTKNELNVLQKRLRDLSELRVSLEARILELKRIITQLDSEVGSLKSQHSSLATKLKNLQTLSDNAVAKGSELQTRKDNLEKQRKTQLEKLQRAKEIAMTAVGPAANLGDKFGTGSVLAAGEALKLAAEWGVEVYDIYTIIQSGGFKAVVRGMTKDEIVDYLYRELAENQYQVDETRNAALYEQQKDEYAQQDDGYHPNLPRPNTFETIVNYQLAGCTHPDTGVMFTPDGYPDFEPYAITTVEIVMVGLNRVDFRRANEAAGFGSQPYAHTRVHPNTIWHHHQDGIRMLLVPSDIHNKTAHTGGGSKKRLEIAGRR